MLHIPCLNRAIDSLNRLDHDSLVLEIEGKTTVNLPLNGIWSALGDQLCGVRMDVSLLSMTCCDETGEESFYS